MSPIDLDVTRNVRAYMTSRIGSGDLNLERVQSGLREATWYSPKDRRTLRALCDQSPSTLTRWLFERERDGLYTGLIMVWPAGYSTPIHDHNGLWGIEWVLQGALIGDGGTNGEMVQRMHLMATDGLERSRQVELARSGD